MSFLLFPVFAYRGLANARFLSNMPGFFAGVASGYYPPFLF